MSETAHETTETQGAVIVSDHGGVLLRISTGGLWVNPDIPADECAQRVLASLRPILSHTIDTEVNIQVARLTAERNEAQAEVERLKEQVGALTLAVEQADEMKAHAEAAAAAEEAETDRVMVERDAAQAEVERLTKERNKAKADLEWLRATQSAQNLDMANGQAILDSSRPTDEDIWREAFMRQLFDHDVEKLMNAADLAVALYRKRWPR